MAPTLRPKRSSVQIRHATPKAVLCKWYLLPCVEERSVQLVGQKVEEPSDKMALYTTSTIVKRFSYTVVETDTGSVYQVSGQIDMQKMIENGFSHNTISSMSFGFPHNWEDLVDADLRRSTTPAEESHGISSQLPASQTDLQVIQEEPSPISPLVEVPNVEIIPKVPKAGYFVRETPYIQRLRPRNACANNEPSVSNKNIAKPPAKNKLEKKPTVPACKWMNPKADLRPKVPVKLPAIPSLDMLIRNLEVGVLNKTSNELKNDEVSVQKKTVASGAIGKSVNNKMTKPVQAALAQPAKKSRVYHAKDVLKNNGRNKQPVAKQAPSNKSNISKSRPSKRLSKGAIPFHPSKRTEKWFRGVAEQILGAKPANKSNFTLLNGSGSKSGSKSANQTLPEAQWPELDNDEMLLVRHIDTTKTFRMSLKMNLKSPLPSTRFLPSNADKASDRLNFAAFLDHEKQMGKQVQHFAVSTREMSRQLNLKLPELPENEDEDE